MEKIIKNTSEPAAKPPFEEVYSEYYQQLLFYIGKHISNYQDAEDLCSEVFSYCYKNYDSYDASRSAVSTWIYLVAGSRLKNYYRDRKDFADVAETEEKVFSYEPDMDSAVYLTELRKALAGLLESLSERERQIVILHFFREKSSEAIADELCLSAGNVRVILHRALKKLGELAEKSDFDWRI